MPACVPLVVFPVTNLAQAAVAYGALLGVDPSIDAPYYVGFRRGDQEVGLDPHGHKSGLTGPLVYWRADNIHAKLEQLVAAGFQVHKPVTDIGGGLLIAWVKDPDGNITGLRQEP